MSRQAKNVPPGFTGRDFVWEALRRLRVADCGTLSRELAKTDVIVDLFWMQLLAADTIDLTYQPVVDRMVRIQPALPGDLAMDDVSPKALATLEAIARGVLADQDALLDKICEMTLPKAAQGNVCMLGVLANNGKGLEQKTRSLQGKTKLHSS